MNHTADTLYPTPEQAPYRLTNIVIFPDDGEAAEAAFTQLLGDPLLTDGKNIVEKNGSFLEWKSPQTTQDIYTETEYAWLLDLWQRLIDKGMPRELLPVDAPAPALSVKRNLQKGTFTVEGLAYLASAKADIAAGNWPK